MRGVGTNLTKALLGWTRSVPAGHFVILMGLLVALAECAWALNPPRIIGELTGNPPARFAEDFLWVGDQNGDGCDDLFPGQ